MLKVKGSESSLASGSNDAVTTNDDVTDDARSLEDGRPSSLDIAFTSLVSILCPELGTFHARRFWTLASCAWSRMDCPRDRRQPKQKIRQMEEACKDSTIQF